MVDDCFAMNDFYEEEDESEVLDDLWEDMVVIVVEEHVCEFTGRFCKRNVVFEYCLLCILGLIEDNLSQIRRML